MEEKKKEIPAPSACEERWTEIEYLPAWSEEFYDVYTAKKFGKWVMLKTLRKEFRDDPAYQAMIDKEFDVRYNLSHPNIVMINDYEDVPGLGRCIITDDVYGKSLRNLLDENALSDKHYEQLKTRLPLALEYIQLNHLAHHPVRPETIIFTENIGNLKLIDVGFEQKPSLSTTDTAADIENFGKVLDSAMKAAGCEDPVLRRVVKRCSGSEPKRRFRDIQELKMALENKGNKRLYFLVIAFLVFMILILLWLLSPYSPAPPEA